MCARIACDCHAPSSIRAVWLRQFTLMQLLHNPPLSRDEEYYFAIWLARAYTIACMCNQAMAKFDADVHARCIARCARHVCRARFSRTPGIHRPERKRRHARNAAARHGHYAFHGRGEETFLRNYIATEAEKGTILNGRSYLRPA